MLGTSGDSRERSPRRARTSVVPSGLLRLSRWSSCLRVSCTLACMTVVSVACGEDRAISGFDGLDADVNSSESSGLSVDGGVLLPDGALLADAQLLPDGAIVLADGATYGGGDATGADVADTPIPCTQDHDCQQDTCRVGKCVANICHWLGVHNQGGWCRRAAGCTVWGHCQNGDCLVASSACGSGNAQCCSSCSSDAQCNDHAECTKDSCDPVTHMCTFELTASCKKACTVDDQCAYAAGAGAYACVSGWCQAKTAVGKPTCESAADCDDEDACTVDACILLSAAMPGRCAHAPVLTQCGLQCTQKGTEICHDGNPCTEDTCGADGHCASAWTGQCGPPPCFGAQDCDDGNPCTTDACELTGDDVQICTHKLAASGDGCCTKDAECDDGVACTGDYCVENRCNHAQQASAQPCDVPCKAAADCFDGHPWTSDTCVSGKCSYTTTACECAEDSDCHTGNMDFNTPTNWCLRPGCFDCKCGFRERNCSDGDPCTADTCQPKNCDLTNPAGCGSGQCVHDLVAGCAERICNKNDECDDGNPCTDEWCDGICRRTTRNCDDGNPCTADACVAGSGACEHSLVAGLCGK